MAYRRVIFVFIEGSDDERFFDGVIRPVLADRYDTVIPWQYAQRSKGDVEKALTSARRQKADCLFLADIDTHPCVTARRQGLLDAYRNRLDPSWVVVVIREIESWYLAGLDDEQAGEMRLSPVRHTDGITKEQFRQVMPGRFKASVVDFMAEILRGFRSDVARTKNRSFCYLMDKLGARSQEA